MVTPGQRKHGAGGGSGSGRGFSGTHSLALYFLTVLALSLAGLRGRMTRGFRLAARLALVTFWKYPAW